MTDTTRNVELVIRAKNLSKKTLDDVRKEIEEINKALDEQVDASKRGQGSLKDLDAAYRRLDEAMKSLVDQQKVIKQFEAQSAQLEKLQVALGSASTRLREHKAVMEATEKVTKRQTQQYNSYQAAVDKADSALAKQASRLSETRAAGEALGLAMNDLVGSQNKILATGRELSTSYDRQSEAVKNFASDVAQANRVAQAAAETQLFDRQAADAARLVKAGDYVNFWITELDKLEVAEKRLAGERSAAKAFDDSARAAADLVKAGDYVNFWSKSLDELDATQKKLANSKSLNEMADDAIAASKGYTTLGDASSRLVQNNKLLSASIRDILDPSSQVRSSLKGVEETVDSVGRSIKGISGPVTDYKAKVAELVAANKALSTQAAGIDAYQKQVVALRAAREEFSKNRAELTAYAATLRTAGEPTATMEAKLRRLKSALEASSASLKVEIGTTRELRQGLREAGIATNDLGAAQARLVGAAKSSANAMNNLNGAVNRYGTSTEKAAARGNVFESNGRTTLSLLQRIRGEVLALGAAYIGLQGTIGLANDSLGAYNTKQGIQNQLALSVGDDPGAIAAEYEYIRQQADRIGISFEEAAKGYTKFSAAARLAGRSQQEVRYVAESFLEVGRVANLSADNIDGVFKALEQVYSKGKIQAEELRGQLGDRLFGAFEIAAKALKDQFPDLDKAMKNGMITSAQLVAIAEEYRKTVAGRLPQAMSSLAANQDRLNSAFYQFKVLVAESGFADEYAKLINQITVFFQSEDGAKFAKGLSDAFSTIAATLGFLLEHIDEVQLALELTFGLKALTMIGALAGTITSTLIPALLAMSVQLNATGLAGIKAFGGIKTAFGVLAATFIGLEIGAYLRNEFLVVEQAGIALVTGLQKAAKVIEAQFKIAGEQMSLDWRDIMAEMANNTTSMVRRVLTAARDISAAMGNTKAAEGFGKILETITFKYSAETEDSVAAIKSKLKADLAEIDRIGFEMFQDAANRRNKESAVDKPTGTTDKPPITTGAAGPSGPTDKELKAQQAAVNKRISLADQLVRALEAAEQKIQRNEKLSLEQRLASIDTEYAKVYRKIEALSAMPGGEGQAEQMKSTLDSLVEQLKIQETLKFNQEEMNRNEKTLNDQIALRAQLLSTIETQRKAGLITELQAKAQIAEADAKIVPSIQAAADAAIAFALAHKEVFADQTAMDTYIAKMQGIKDGTVAVKDELISIEQLNEMVAGGLTNAFDQFAKSVADGEDAIGSLKDAFMNFVADFLRQIAMMIIKQLILNALQNSNPYGAAAGAALGVVNGATQAHSGAVIGSGGRGGRSVSAPASWFAGAPKYHSGGVVGLAADEYPAILQRNEEVLANDDPRNVVNGGGDAGGSGGASVQPLTINNHIDAESFMSAALATSKGQKMIMNVLSANRTQVKSLVRS